MCVIELRTSRKSILYESRRSHCILLSLLYLLPRRQDAERGVWETLGGLAAATLLSLGNAASSSRTGAAQLAVIMVMALVWKNQRQRSTAAS